MPATHHDIDIQVWHRYLEFAGKASCVQAGGIAEASELSQELRKCVSSLCHVGLGHLLRGHYLHMMESQLTEVLLPRFWQSISRSGQHTGIFHRISGDAVDKSLPLAVRQLCEAVAQLRSVADVIDGAMRLPRIGNDDGTSMSVDNANKAGFTLPVHNPVARPFGEPPGSLAQQSFHMVHARVISSAPPWLPGLLRRFFRQRLRDFSRASMPSVEPAVARDEDTLGDPDESIGDSDEGDGGGPADDAGDDDAGDSRQLDGRLKVNDSLDGEGDGVNGWFSHVRADCKGGLVADASMYGTDRMPMGSDPDSPNTDASCALCGPALPAHPAGAAVPTTSMQHGLPREALLQRVVSGLRLLGLGPLAEEACVHVVFDRVQRKLAGSAQGVFDRPLLRHLLRWVERVPLRFLAMLAPPPLRASAPPLDASLAACEVTMAFNVRPTGAQQYVAGNCHPAHGHIAGRLRAPKFMGVASGLGSSSSSSPYYCARCVAAHDYWRSRLGHLVAERLCLLRIGQMFEIVVDFPDSAPAIADLRACLDIVGLHRRLATAFRSALQQRLLHPGAATTDILQQYVSTIKTLQALDPAGVLLEVVSGPVCEYLRGRKDTIRCIVTMLTDDGSDGGGDDAGGGDGGGGGVRLFEEMSAGNEHLTKGEDSDGDEEWDTDAALAASAAWEPDPVDADPSKPSKSRRQVDVVSMLVGIYGNRELLVAEYRQMLAERLLSRCGSYDTDREVRTVELLKLRFGEASLAGAEVILKDMADSKRVAANVRVAQRRAREARGRVAGGEQGDAGDAEADEDVLDATIVSALFWPTLPTEDLQLPRRVDRLLAGYGAQYHALKAPRKLGWKPSLGTVRLQLDFGPGGLSQEYTVSPAHAAIILCFETEGAGEVDGRQSWRLYELAAKLGMTTGAVQRRAALWVNYGVLQEQRGSTGASNTGIVYELVDMEHAGAARMAGAGTTWQHDEEGDEVSGADRKLQAEMAVYEQFVMGMLTNFEALPLDRIHNMLKIFVADPPYDRTMQQLATFLGHLVAEDRLEFLDGMYKMKK
eukprot:jgi/Mesvir1/27084/Mv20772-RA.1